MPYNINSKKQTKIQFNNHLKGERQVVGEVIVLNVIALFSLLFSIYSNILSFFGGFAILFYISVRTLNNPKRTMFILFGTKFMLDAFWSVRLQLPGLENINLLVLSLFPLLIMLFLSPKTINSSSHKYVVHFIIYLIWVFISSIINNYSFNLEAFIRQAGILLGFLFGLKFIKTIKDFNFLIYIVFVATIIPVVMSIMQLMPFFRNLPIFHFKMDSVRLIRYSGLYYDPATTGMINIISFLTNAYLLINRRERNWKLFAHATMLLANLVVAAIGGTRSILIVMLVMAVIMLLKNLKGIVVIAPLVVVAYISTQPYLDRTFQRTTKDVLRNANIGEMLSDTENRTMLTGRVGVWQKIKAEYDSGTIFQKMLGKGIISNAHSIYFFLLLQIGILGLVYFIFINFDLLLSIGRCHYVKSLKLIAFVALCAFLVIGLSATTIGYTSFQWVTFMIVASVLNINSYLRHSNTIFNKA